VRIACAFDHAGVPLRQFVFETLAGLGHETVDLGVATTDPVDYPDIARLAAERVLSGDAERAVIVCGSGAGVAIAACKFPGIRAFVGHDTYTAHQAVEHDDGNVLCMGGRVIGPLIAAEVLAAFCASTFSGEERHVRRLGKIAEIEREFAPGP
jgi:ribose 5-phosphate isomerase B